MGNYIRNDIRNHVVRYVGTDVTPEIGIGIDVISSEASYFFLYVYSPTLFPTLFAKTFFYINYLILMENNILTKHQFFKNGAILLNDPIQNSEVRSEIKS